MKVKLFYQIGNIDWDWDEKEPYIEIWFYLQAEDEEAYKFLGRYELFVEKIKVKTSDNVKEEIRKKANELLPKWKKVVETLNEISNKNKALWKIEMEN